MRQKRERHNRIASYVRHISSEPSKQSSSPSQTHSARMQRLFWHLNRSASHCTATNKRIYTSHCMMPQCTHTYSTHIRCNWCLHGLAPRYLSDYIQSVADSNRRHLRSSSSSQLVIRRTRLSTVGDRAFPVAGSYLWNSLPPDVTSASTLSVFRASKLISFPDHFLPNCFRFLVLHTVYSSGLAVFVL